MIDKPRGSQESMPIEFFIRPSKTGRIKGSPVASGCACRRRPVLCPEHISKTILAMVMKFDAWIGLIKGGGCNAHDL